MKKKDEFTLKLENEPNIESADDNEFEFDFSEEVYTAPSSEDKKMTNGTEEIADEPEESDEVEEIAAEPEIENEVEEAAAEPEIEDEVEEVAAEPEESDEVEDVAAEPEIEDEVEEAAAEPEIENEVEEAAAEPEIENEAEEVADEPEIENEVEEAADEPEIENEVEEAADEPEIENEVEEAADEPEIENEVEEAADEIEISNEVKELIEKLYSDLENDNDNVDVMSYFETADVVSNEEFIEPAEEPEPLNIGDTQVYEPVAPEDIYNEENGYVDAPDDYDDGYDEYYAQSRQAKKKKRGRGLRTFGQVAALLLLVAGIASAISTVAFRATGAGFFDESNTSSAPLYNYSSSNDFSSGFNNDASSIDDVSSEIFEQLSFGDSGDKVLEIQQRLYELGYLDSDNINSVYDASTQIAVREFQSVNGLKETGAVDEETYNMLLSDDAAIQTTTTATITTTATTTTTTTTTTKSTTKRTTTSTRKPSTSSTTEKPTTSSSTSSQDNTTSSKAPSSSTTSSSSTQTAKPTASDTESSTSASSNNGKLPEKAASVNSEGWFEGWF